MKKTEKSNTNEIIEIPAEEAPYALPDGWKWVRLGDLYEVNPKNVAESCIEAAFIPMEKIKPGMVSEFSYEVKPWGIAKKGHTQFADGDVAFAKITPCFENRKSMMLYNLPNGIGAGTTELIVLRQPNVLQKYTFWLINSENFIKGGKNTYSGTVGQQRISMDFVRNYPIPLPPLETQKRIVDRIESLFAKLDEAKEKAQTALDTFELRKSAILHKAFTGELTAQWREENRNVAVTSEHSDNLTSALAERPNNITSVSTERLDNISSVPSSLSNKTKQEFGNNIDFCSYDFDELDKNYEKYNIRYFIPPSWKWVTLNCCCNFIGSGVTPKGGSEIYLNIGIPFIRSQNVLKGKLDLSEVVYISEDINNKMKRTQIVGGETLLNITGASIGRSCFVPYNQNIGNVNQHVCIIRFKDYVKPELPQYWFNSPDTQRFIIENQIGETRQALNFKQIRGMNFPLPPLSEQQEIVRILDDLLAKENAAKEAAEAVIEKIDLMKKSILARAFRGEL